MRRSNRDASFQRVHPDSSETGRWQPARISNFNWIQGSEKKIFLKIVFSLKVSTCECIPFLIFFKISRDMIERCTNKKKLKQNKKYSIF